MATAKLCKAAKDYPEIGVVKGEMYYWWKFPRGAKQRSKTAPKPQQLTQSGFRISVLDLGDRLDALAAMDSHEDLKSEVESIISDATELRDEQESNKANMPALDSFVTELEAIDLDDEDQQSIIDAVQAVSLEA